MNHKHYKIDPGHTRDMGGKRGGIVGESAIWDGPLSQIGRLHGDCLLYTSPSPRDS